VRPFRVPPLGAVLLVALAFEAGAQEPPVRLRLSPALGPTPPETGERLPVFVDAEDIQGVQEKSIEARGSARLRTRGKAVFADWLLYSQPEEEVEAAGSVRLERDGDVIDGTRLKLNLETERGTMQAPRFRFVEPAGRGNAEELRLEGRDRYGAKQAAYTSCGPGNDDWYLRAGTLDLDRERQIGTARDARVEFLGRTIFYSPWLDFSLDQGRKSGFLTPSLSTSGKSGFEVAVPYYWNIAPNRDATVTPRVLAKRGFMLGGEFRYLERSFAGEARAEVLPDDRERNGDRRDAFFWRHTQAYGPWQGYLNIQNVSDDNYFRDLSSQIQATSLALLPREVQVARSGSLGPGGIWTASALVQRWQTLQDPLAPITPPYNRQPQITLDATRYDMLGTDVGFTGAFVEFDHPTLVTGSRLVAYPSVRVPLQNPYAYLTPKVGVHYTHYALDPNATTPFSSTNRSLPIMSADSGVVFERSFELAGSRMLQTLEPRLYYVYIPYRDQNNLPNFDSAVADVTFASIFSENQFSGSDRINDANQLTAGLASRLIDPLTGIERLRAGVAQRFYYESQRVTLPGVPARSGTSSDFLAALSGTIAPGLITDIGWQYNTEFSETRRFAVGGRYQPQPGKVLNLGYRFIRDSIEQVDLSGQWPFGGGWYGVGRLAYSLPDSRVVVGLAGIEYDGGCWAMRLVVNNVAVGTNDFTRSVFLQLELNGVSRVGSNPIETLKRNIAGYTKFNEPVESRLPPARY